MPLRSDCLVLLVLDGWGFLLSYLAMLFSGGWFPGFSNVSFFLVSLGLFSSVSQLVCSCVFPIVGSLCFELVLRPSLFGGFPRIDLVVALRWFVSFARRRWRAPPPSSLSSPPQSTVSLSPPPPPSFPYVSVSRPFILGFCSCLCSTPPVFHVGSFYCSYVSNR